MSFLRRTSVAAAALTGCTLLTTLLTALVLVVTLAATPAAPGQAAPAQAPGKHHTRHQTQPPTMQKALRAPRKHARLVTASTRQQSKAQQRMLHRLRTEQARRPARLRSFHDRLLGAQPVLSYRGAADPTVARYYGGYVAISTGPGAPRAVAPQPGGPWTNIPSALTVQPSWAISGRYWASDLVQVNGLWLLYFTAEVAGLGLDARCIGVATATDPTGAFVPDEKPLVCPKGAGAPPAYDRIKRRGRDVPHGGVIDPEYYKDRGGQQYLLYRTQGTPSTIRIVPLPGSGRAEGSARSTELVRRPGVIENPTMLRRGRTYVLITSEDDFVNCGYKTTSRRSTKLLDWSRSQRQVLLDTGKSGLCGPGGADLGRGPNGETMLFFHAWTCPELGTNCPSGPNYDRKQLYDARRSMFAAVLRFSSNKAPKIASYVAPIAPPPPTPTPSPTPTPTATPTTIAPRP